MLAKQEKHKERMTSSMYNSIHHFNEFGVKRIEKIIKEFIKEGKDLADLIFGLEESLFELGRNILVEVLEDMDQHLRDSALRKNDWEIVRNDATQLLTSFGMIKYKRTYFKPKKGGKRRYLVDDIVGIAPHDRVSADVVINAIEEATDSSYRKAGKKASYVNEISKQAVMNKIHKLEITQPEIKAHKKKDIEVLYIEADEDHVALQNKNNNDGGDNYSKIAMPKLVYVHEGYDYEKSSENRRVLKNVRYFGGIYKNNEDLWLEVCDYIYERYNIDSIETIYLSGDGASWIKQGLDWIPKSKFVLDEYHLQKYIRRATAHLEDSTIHQELQDALDWPSKEKTKKVFKKILKLTESETKKESIKESRRYILNQWAGIEIKADKPFEIIGCSAEGHVSHILSDRLSSRPRGWSEVGVKKMAELRIYKRNGGKVYDLVMKQKRSEKAEEKYETEERLVKELRSKAARRYANAWNSNLVVTAKGKRTGLYNELKTLSGI